MATLLLTAAASALGGSLGLGTIGTAVLGAAATAAGSLIDRSIIAALAPTEAVEGPRLQQLQVMDAAVGAPIPRVYGRVRLGGQILWATDLQEVATTEHVRGGKGGGGGGQDVTSYSYFANVAVGLCEGEIAAVTRIWADGQEINLSAFDIRVHTGSESQAPDPLLVSVIGAAGTPAYRGLAYVVFERFALADFGNRLPQLTFEVLRPAPGARAEATIKAVNIIPGSTEFGYHPTVAVQKVERSFSGQARSQAPENVHTSSGQPDMAASLDLMRAVLPALGHASLVVAWFGTDLRCGVCRIKPGVEVRDKSTTPIAWSVGGIDRASAHLVTQYTDPSGRTYPAYGGTPCDASVLAALRELKGRGLAVTFYPFIMMDIATGNGLPDPFGGAEQAAFPWRGRITCHPAPGRAGTVDGTAEAGASVAAFLGSAAPSHFSIAGDAVTYSGPKDDFGYRRFVLHQAFLAKASGAVDVFLVGSEMVGLTRVRSAAGTYPFVAGLRTLLGEVRAILGPGVELSYAADWSEYHSNQLPGGTLDFNMDALWADPDCDFVGIDNYFPISDWRDGAEHADLDPAGGVSTIYSARYLKANCDAGELVDWFYASEADRASQLRTPITDGLGMPWVYRQKDLRSWWSNPHRHRAGGALSGESDWVAGSKPIVFTELGCPALDKATNQPNVFFDPKSSESLYPHFSTGRRDDVLQRLYIEAWHAWARDAARNPPGMVDPERLFVWAWDARPFPSFPQATGTWADAPNWRSGHWINDRFGGVYAPDLIRHIAADYGVSRLDASAAFGSANGYVIDRPMSLREAFQPLSLALRFDFVERAGEIVAVSRHDQGARLAIDDRSLAETGQARISIRRSQDSELPKTVRLTFVDGEADYQTSTATATNVLARTSRVSDASIPIVLSIDRATAAAEDWLREIVTARESYQFALMPSQLAVEPGDVVSIDVAGFRRSIRVQGIADGEARSVEARSFEATSTFASAPASTTPPDPPAPPTPAGAQPVLWDIADLPILAARPTTHGVLVASTSGTGSIAFYSAPSEAGGFRLDTLTRGRPMGELRGPLAPGPEGVFDTAQSVEVELYSGALLSRTRADILASPSTNLCAVRSRSGAFELFQFCEAVPLAKGVYRLSTLLRALRGTDDAMRAGALAGATFFPLPDDPERSSTITDAEAFLTRAWRVGPSSRPIDDPLYSTRRIALGARARLPFSPVHPSAASLAGGGVRLSWIRRSTSTADDWSTPGDLPPGEGVRRYRVEIRGAAAPFSAEVEGAETLLVPAETVRALYGAMPSAIDLSIAQWSEGFGLGISRPATVRVR